MEVIGSRLTTGEDEGAPCHASNLQITRLLNSRSRRLVGIQKSRPNSASANLAGPAFGWRPGNDPTPDPAVKDVAIQTSDCAALWEVTGEAPSNSGRRRLSTLAEFVLLSFLKSSSRHQDKKIGLQFIVVK